MRYLFLYAAINLIAASQSATQAADEVSANRTPLKDLVERLASDDMPARKAAADALLANYDGTFEPPQFDDENELAKQLQIRAELKPLFPQLQRLLESKHDDCRETAAYLMAVLGPDAKDAEPALLKTIRSTEASGGIRMAAFTALLHVTPRDRALGPTLLEVYNAHGDGDVETEKEAKRRAEHEEVTAGIGATAIALMLAQSGRAAIEVPTLVEMTAGKYRRGIRLTFIYALAELGSECRAAVPELRKLLFDDDRRIRSAAGWAVLCIDGDSAKLPDVLKAMSLDEKEDADFQESVSRFFKEKADIMKSLRDEPEEMMPQLLRQVNYNNPFYQRQAIRLLGEIGPEAKVAIPVLVVAARSDDKFTRDTATAALKQIDPSALPPDVPASSAK
jgi:HEAT repeat protein